MIGGKAVKLWRNPNSDKYISITFTPSHQYGFIGDLQIDNLGDSGDEIELIQSQVDSWLEYAKDW